jgi:hypothetical protein
MNKLNAQILGLAMVLVCPSGRSFAASIPGLYGTGVLADGSLAPGGSVDLHYALISTPSGAAGTAYATTSMPSIWEKQGTNSQWIAPNPNGNAGLAVGFWTYRTTFFLPQDLDPTTVSITGNCAGDNGIILYLNGQLVVPNLTGFSVLHNPFRITNGFTAGVNMLDFVVENVGPGLNPTGMRMDNLQGTALPISEQPILSIRVSQVELCWDTLTNIVYQIQYNSELTTNQWVNWGGAFAGTGGPICTNDAVTQVRRLYRLVVTP